jgi:formate hydrogenlyase subunit 6/NADH:ubiquinone oxidoreductase subunit I
MPCHLCSAAKCPTEAVQMRFFHIHAQPAQEQIVQADLFAVFQLISLPKTCKP